MDEQVKKAFYYFSLKKGIFDFLTLLIHEWTKGYNQETFTFMIIGIRNLHIKK